MNEVQFDNHPRKKLTLSIPRQALVVADHLTPIGGFEKVSKLLSVFRGLRQRRNHASAKYLGTMLFLRYRTLDPLDAQLARRGIYLRWLLPFVFLSL